MICWPDTSALKAEYPAPPRLHWLWLALVINVPSLALVVHNYRLHLPRGTVATPTQTTIWISILTLIVSAGWPLVQVQWFRKVFPGSRAYPLILVYSALQCGLFAADAFEMRHGTNMGHLHLLLETVFSLVSFAMYLWANFTFRDELQQHYSDVEPIKLDLSGVMTFFFSMYYFQYNFRKIALLKDEAAAIPAQQTA
jgi:hypothetical protein